MVPMESADGHASYWKEISKIIRSVTSGLRGTIKKHLVSKMLEEPRA